MLSVGRKRKNGANLPPRVYRRSSGRYQFKPLHGASEIIAHKHATTQEVWDEWKKRTVVDGTSLSYFAEEYYKSNWFMALKPRTQDDYRKECSKVPLNAFKGWDASFITPADIHKYMQARGQKSIRRANLELTWFKNVFANAQRLGLVKVSPAKDLLPLRLNQKQKVAQRAKKRHVSNEDYTALLAVVTAPVQVAMEVSYCTGIRQGDVLKLKWEDVVGESMYVMEGKTDNEFYKKISPRLRAALELAKTLPGHAHGGWVVRSRTGQRYTRSGFGANFKRAKAKLPKAQQFTFHDIRHKAITEAERSKKQEFSMHRDARMLGVYDHELPESPSH